MDALQTKLDTIANNLANVNTTGFKQDRCNFEDLFYRNEVLPGNQDSAGQFTPTGIHVGLGVRVQSVQADFAQGAFEQTNRPLDWAIVGDGLFQVTDPSGQILVHPGRKFRRECERANRHCRRPPMADCWSRPSPFRKTRWELSSARKDWFRCSRPARRSLQQVGQIQLARFINPQGLLKLGENLFQETVSSGPPLQGNPGTVGLGQIRQNALENSNVNPVNQLIDLITTQRAFELNSQVVQTGDQMLQLISNLRRF